MKTKTTRILALVICITLFAATAAFAAELPKDITDERLAEAVNMLMDAGAVTGDVDGLFHPDANLTRAQVCSIIVKLINPPAAELLDTPTVSVPAGNFTDLSGYGWAAPYINYSANNSIAKGYNDGTFKPGNNVTFAELVTFTVRACGFTDSDLTGEWPANYLEKAEELKLFTEPADMGMVTETGATPADMAEQMQQLPATKAQAAMLIYNASQYIKEANPVIDQPQGTEKDKADGMPDVSGFIFGNGAFDSDMASYSGKAIASNVIIYVYGDKSEYKSDMTFGKAASDYRLSTVNKYKSVKTPAFYKLENGKITEMIVPADVGFTGRIYCVINDASVNMLNFENEKVTGIETLTAAREILWPAQKNLTGIPAKTGDGYLNGNVYELTARNGEIRQISKAGDPGISGRKFDELTNGYETVTARETGLVQLTSGVWYEIKDNAAVYTIDKVKQEEYETGTLNSIKKNVEVRLYDISDDDEASADIIIVRK